MLKVIGHLCLTQLFGDQVDFAVDVDDVVDVDVTVNMDVDAIMVVDEDFAVGYIGKDVDTGVDVNCGEAISMM